MAGPIDLKPRRVSSRSITRTKMRRSQDRPAGRTRRKPWRYRWPGDFRDEARARSLDLDQGRPELERLTGLAASPTGPADAAPAIAADRLLGDIRSLIEAAREQTARAVNSALVGLYWHIGKRACEDVLQEKRAEYGERTVETLAARLTADYGRGFEVRNEPAGPSDATPSNSKRMRHGKSHTPMLMSAQGQRATEIDPDLNAANLSRNLLVQYLFT